MISKETKHFLQNWGIISCTAFALNFLLWWLTTDDKVAAEYQYNATDYIFDFIYCALYVLVSLVVSNLIRRLFLCKHQSFTLFFMHSGAMLVANVMIAIAFESVMNSIYHGNDEFFWDRIYVFTTIATLLTIIYLCLYYSSVIIQQNHHNVEMQKELLKLQLDPHFVFNSLSTLTELISDDQELAETFTIKFSAIYRYIINQLNRETVAVASEMTFLHDYCDLLDIRHPGHFIFDIDPKLELDSTLILPMSVQTLVENAVKHNSHSSRKPLTISVYRDGDYIAVKNSIVPLTGKSPTTTRIGLKNLKERYALLGLRPIIEEGKEFIVKLPIINDKKHP